MFFRRKNLIKSFSRKHLLKFGMEIGIRRFISVGICLLILNLIWATILLKFHLSKINASLSTLKAI